MELSQLQTRRIFKSATARGDEVRELLQLIFISELLAPGDRTWLVSPWISDVVILDNRSGQFSPINPEWPKSEIRLTQITLHLISVGVGLVVVTRPDPHNRYFIDKLKDELDAHGLPGSLLSIQVREDLHSKGILTRKGLLLGSMNITRNGLDILEESVEYVTTPSVVADAWENFEQLYLDSN